MVSPELSGDAESMCGIPAKKSRDRLDNGLLIDVPRNSRNSRNSPEISTFFTGWPTSDLRGLGRR